MFAVGTGDRELKRVLMFAVGTDDRELKGFSCLQLGQTIANKLDFKFSRLNPFRF
jgi:hypothetical protein